MKSAARFNPGDVRIDTRTVTLERLFLDLEEGKLVHDYPWGQIDTHQHLWRIEGILMGVQTKPLVVIEHMKGGHKWGEVGDAHNRHDLAFVCEFMRGKLRLANLDYLPQYNGHDYASLPRYMQRRLLENWWITYRLDLISDPECHADMVRRLTTDW